ncbi:MAG: hypothetical protein DRP58_02770 [Spirochaetes bacterium]|nr:MAG: hypothetical protein DRP58_02770 [Spirochaetota bacterium]
MAGIGFDIKDVLEELGTSLIIYRYPGPTLIEEKIDHEFFTTHSSEFLRMFFSKATLVVDTQIVTGDIVSAMGYYFLVTANTPSYFENSIVDWTAVFYRCNCLGKLSRYPQRGTWDSNYEKVTDWSDIETDIHALQYENVRDSSQFVEEDVLAMSIQGNLLFLPGYVEVEEGDRWYPIATDLTKFYRIASIDSLRIENVSICILKEDERE